MSITKNNTLPDLWNPDINYKCGDYVTYLNIIYRSIKDGENKNPKENKDYWSPLDIYLKDSTVMEHGDYSGDEEFWQRDNIYIDASGFVYLNNENTGINVNGWVHKDISFSDLSDEEKASLKGDKGDKGEQGLPGADSTIPGPQGPQGSAGKSAYQSWLDEGYTGTEEDFVNWIRSGIITLDTAPSITSHNGIENQAITNAFITYQRKVNELLDQYNDRITDLENRLKAIYQDTEHTFRFGITDNGQYGYKIDNTDTVYPFQQTTSELNSIGVELINGLGLSDLGQHYILNENTILNLDNELRSASLSNNVSTNSRTLNRNVTIGENVQTQDFDDFFSDVTYIYLFKDNEFVNDEMPYNLENMIYDTEHTPYKLYSKGNNSYEGIWFGIDSVSSIGSRIKITVEPYECESVKIVIGNTTDTTHTIEEIINDSTLQVQKITKTITKKTVIELDNIAENQRIYFFSNNTTNQFRITEILVS